jgi:hypothetical protein
MHILFKSKIEAKFLRLSEIARGNNIPVIPSPHYSQISNYTAFKVKTAFELLNQTTLQDISDYCESIKWDGLPMTEATKHDLICIHYSYCTDRDEPYFNVVLTTRFLLTGLYLESERDKFILCGDHAYKVIGLS